MNTIAQLNAVQLKKMQNVNDILKHLDEGQTVSLAAIADFIYDKIADTKRTIVAERSKTYERECKHLSRYLQAMLDMHSKLQTYKTTKAMRAEIKAIKDWLHEETDDSINCLYYAIRNEVINSNYVEDMIETTIQCRILAMCIRVMNRMLVNLGVTMGFEFNELLHILDLISIGYVDADGNQARSIAVFENKVTILMQAS